MMRAQMLKEGYRAVKIWTFAGNGGTRMEVRWHILKGAWLRAGDLAGGYVTKKEAWRVAEDHYARVNHDSAYIGDGSLDEVVGL